MPAMKNRDDAEAKRYWEATWTALGLRPLYIRDGPAVVMLKVGVQGQQLADLARQLAIGLQSFAKKTEEEIAQSQQPETEVAEAAPSVGP